jgi:hypothetical protein
MGWLAALFAEEGAGSAVSSAATSTATTAAENAALAQAGSTAASVTAAGQAATAAQTGITTAQALQYVQQGATLLQGISGYTSGRQNAEYDKAAGKNALRVGAANKNLMDARGRAQLGELRAQMGAEGTTITGSPMLVYLDSVHNAAIESANEYYKGKIQSTAYKQQAKISRKGGQADLWSGIIGGVGPSAISLGSRLLSTP